MSFALVLLALIFIAAGALHFLRPLMYMQIVPAYLPWPRFIVLLSGLCEMLGGLGLLLPATRRAAAWGLVALLIAVMPANIQMALDHDTKWRRIPEWLLWARLPLQLPLMWWAWLYTRR